MRAIDPAEGGGDKPSPKFVRAIVNLASGGLVRVMLVNARRLEHRISPDGAHYALKWHERFSKSHGVEGSAHFESGHMGTVW